MRKFLAKKQTAELHAHVFGKFWVLLAGYNA